MSRQDRQRRARLMHRPAIDEVEIQTRQDFQAARQGRIDISHDDGEDSPMLSWFDTQKPGMRLE